MRREDIIAILKQIAEDHQNELEKSKVKAVKWGTHPDWPWNGIVLSAATRGGSVRWERNVAPRYEVQLSWTALYALNDSERRERFETVGRFWRRTANWLEGVYRQIKLAGGPESVRMKLASMNTESILFFWTSFPDVGDKYARNIMMDVYDPRFRNGSFAIDSRIKSLLPKLGYSGSNRYAAQEDFLNDFANELGLDGWDLDRLLYQAHNRIMASVS